LRSGCAEVVPGPVDSSRRHSPTARKGLGSIAIKPTAALLDLAGHELEPEADIEDVAAGEAGALAATGLDLPEAAALLVPYLAHIFAGSE
jgi:Zn-dependent oligopeptidase